MKLAPLNASQKLLLECSRKYSMIVTICIVEEGKMCRTVSKTVRNEQIKTESRAEFLLVFAGWQVQCHLHYEGNQCL